MSDHTDLKSLITPSLLMLLAEAELPYSKTEFLNFTQVAETMSGSHFKEACEASTARAALVALSKLSPDGSIPPTLDLMAFLPPPPSPEFPQQCYGLQILLDQASRVLFDGIDGRWQSAYFGPLARQLAGQWYALPGPLRPDSWARWRDDAGVSSFDYWVVAQLTWSAPFLHTEDLDSQRIGLALAEETRAAVEAHAGVTDPYRSTRDELLKDDLFFLREVFKGPIKGNPLVKDGSISLSNWAFWWCMIKDAHWPIIERFGRYPYRNGILGRESTAAEQKWLDDTGHLAEVSSEIAARVRDDVEKGKWTPLGER
ncbi:hypothetical protein AK830_g7837 [Neonectria ditissima]|uniref:Uncharacterized protein n=1 Tax=Neonectria ditissima TaxID=78410 RepID=A0A0P7B995_9HYPO|nr:hypothetical protein AK830_g7837 [Neonectria ditissima]